MEFLSVPISQTSCQKMKGALRENKIQEDISDTKRKKSMANKMDGGGG